MPDTGIGVAEHREEKDTICNSQGVQSRKGTFTAQNQSVASHCFWGTIHSPWCGPLGCRRCDLCASLQPYSIRPTLGFKELLRQAKAPSFLPWDLCTLGWLHRSVLWAGSWSLPRRFPGQKWWGLVEFQVEEFEWGRVLVEEERLGKVS